MDLLEREVSLAEIEAAMEDAAAGRGRLALVSGEAGAGKTSLVRHAADAVHRGRVLWRKTVKSVLLLPNSKNSAIADSPTGWAAERANSASSPAFPAEVWNRTDGPVLPYPSQLSTTPTSPPSSEANREAE